MVFRDQGTRSAAAVVRRQMEKVAGETFGRIELELVRIASLGDRQHIGQIVHIGVAAGDIGDRFQIDLVGRAEARNRAAITCRLG